LSWLLACWLTNFSLNLLLRPTLSQLDKERTESFSPGSFIPGIALLAAALLVSVNSLWLGFSFDDHVHLIDAKRSIHSPWQALLLPTWPGNLYRPIYSLSLLLHLDNAFLGHLINVGLYVGCVLLAWRLLVICLPEREAFIASLFFAVLPIHSEPVFAVAFRTELLSFLGLCGALLVSLHGLRSPETPRTGVSKSKFGGLVGSVLAGLLLLFGLLSKDFGCASTGSLPFG